MSGGPQGGRQASAEPKGSTFHQQALAYAKEGIPVFPLRVRDKRPLIPTRDGGNGCKDATTDVEQIERWWSRKPNANIGIATGRESGCFVLDVDIDKGGEESLRALEQEHGELPATKKVKTGTGGWHYYFR